MERGLKDPRIFTLATDDTGRLWFGHKILSRGLGYIAPGFGA